MGERAIDEHADVVLERVGQEIRLDPAAEEVVRGLKRLDGPPAGEVVDLLDVEVRHADVPDLALVDELLERARRFRERDVSDRASGPGRGRCGRARAPAGSPPRPRAATRGCESRTMP